MSSQVDKLLLGFVGGGTKLGIKKAVETVIRLAAENLSHDEFVRVLDHALLDVHKPLYSPRSKQHGTTPP